MKHTQNCVIAKQLPQKDTMIWVELNKHAGNAILNA